MPFIDPNDLLQHYGFHGHEFGCAAPRDYELAAEAFMLKPRTKTMLECIRPAPQRHKCRYDAATQEYGVMRPNGILITYFRPVPGGHIPMHLRTRSEHGFNCNLDYFHSKCNGGPKHAPMSSLLFS
jgi:hypothetical protein